MVLLEVLQKTNMRSAVEEAATKYSSKSDFRLWVEVLDDQNQAQLVKEPNGPWIMIFLKYYDPRNSALHGSRAIYMKKTDKVSELFPIINKLMDWPPGTELRLYEVSVCLIYCIEWANTITGDQTQYDRADEAQTVLPSG